MLCRASIAVLLRAGQSCAPITSTYVCLSVVGSLHTLRHGHLWRGCYGDSSLFSWPLIEVADIAQAVEWILFTLAYTLVALRIGVRVARQQQKHVIVSDVFLIVSALVCLGLIICELACDSAIDSLLSHVQVTL